MSRSRKLQLHIAQIEEIRTILNSMKNLAFIETHKLTRMLAVQGQVVANIEKAAGDFLDFYRYEPESVARTSRMGIVIGSERGFCGDFNERLIDLAATENYSGLIAVGSRLASRLENRLPQATATLPGANVAEEVPAILDRLIDSVISMRNGSGHSTLTVAYHDYITGKIIQRHLLPPFWLAQERMPQRGSPPLLNLDPADFFAELIHHYLFAALHEIFYLSLMAENQSRQQHLDGAVRHLEDETVKLRRKAQIVRQEEITEEIEVILLNSENR
jgi:F-type H+-transporting ATPase subunit gamma